MKIGILSMQEVANYGSYLQAYALKRILEGLGADEVFFINITKGRQIKELGGGRLNKLLRLFKILIQGRVFKRIKDARFFHRLDKSFEDKLEMIGTTTTDIKSLDLIVIGSDEVFNCCQVSGWGFTTQLFGDIPCANRIISYAGSFGNTTYEKLEKYNLTGEIRNSLSNLSEISVRDENSSAIIKKLGFNPILHVDPVLAWKWDAELANISLINREYILLYSYPGRFKDKNEIDEIIRFSKDTNLPIVPILSEYEWCEDTVFPEPPMDVLKYFKSAKYVITDTFHGSILSVVCKKQFCVYVRESNKQKMTSLMHRLMLSERIYENKGDLSSKLRQEIDYDSVEQILDLERNRTKDYLLKYIKYDSI